MFPNLKTSPLYWSLFNYTCPTEAWFRPSFFSGSNMHLGLSYSCRGKPIFKLWVETKSISSTSPQLLLGEGAGTVDSVSSNFTANYCTMRVLAQPDRFICSLTHRPSFPLSLSRGSTHATLEISALRDCCHTLSESTNYIRNRSNRGDSVDSNVLHKKLERELGLLWKYQREVIPGAALTVLLGFKKEQRKLKLKPQVIEERGNVWTV